MTVFTSGFDEAGVPRTACLGDGVDPDTADGRALDFVFRELWLGLRPVNNALAGQQ